MLNSPTMSNASASLLEQIFRRKSVAALMSDCETHEGGLKRALGAIDLTALGIGAIVGAGIFANPRPSEIDSPRRNFGDITSASGSRVAIRSLDILRQEPAL